MYENKFKSATLISVNTSVTESAPCVADAAPLIKKFIDFSLHSGSQKWAGAGVFGNDSRL